MQKVDVLSPRIVRKLLKKYKIKPRKKLGQNFIVSRRYAEIIVSSLMLKPSDKVYEIGAGLGGLTLTAARHAAFIIAVEIDPYLSKALKDISVDYYNVQVVNADALHLGVPSLVNKVLSNVPYSISSKLLIMIAKSQTYELCVLTLQREFVERLLAKPGTREYGRLTVIVNLLCDIERIADIPRQAFYPTPDVDSAVIRLRPAPKVSPITLEKVEELSRRIFSYRRKLVGRALKIAGIYPRGAVPSEIKELLFKRVYELTLEELVLLAEYLFDF